MGSTEKSVVNLTSEVLGNLVCPSHLNGSVMACFRCMAHEKVLELLKLKDKREEELQAECALKMKAIEDAGSLYHHLRSCQDEDCKECYALVSKANNSIATASEMNSGKKVLARIKDIDNTIDSLESMTPKLEKIVQKSEGMAQTLKTFISQHDEDAQQEYGCNCAVCMAAKKLIDPS